jgi:hypothetical protein
MKSSDPNRAHVRAEISIHDALAAIEHFAANYPVERLSAQDAMRLRRAAIEYDKRLALRDFDVSQLSPAEQLKHIASVLGVDAVIPLPEPPAGYGHGV